MAKVIKSNGEESNMTDITLQSLQKAVGGYITSVNLPNGRKLIVNEEGLPNELPYNPKASQLAGQTIVGDVVLCEKGEFR